MAIIAAVRAPLGGILADDNGIRVVNLFRTRRLTWDQVREIDFNESGWDAAGHNPIEWTLAFQTTTGQSVGSQFPRGDKDSVVGAARTTLCACRPLRSKLVSHTSVGIPASPPRL